MLIYPPRLKVCCVVVTVSAKVVWLFYVARSNWVNSENEAHFWTPAKWLCLKTGPIWKQSPTCISTVHICYHNEYHRCLEGLLQNQSDEWLFHVKLAKTDVRLFQLNSTPVKNKHEREILFKNTNMAADWPPGFDQRLTFLWFTSAKVIYLVTIEMEQIVNSIFAVSSDQLAETPGALKWSVELALCKSA